MVVAFLDETEHGLVDFLEALVDEQVPFDAHHFELALAGNGEFHGPSVNLINASILI
jgi:hypothetical protein